MTEASTYLMNRHNATRNVDRIPSRVVSCPCDGCPLAFIDTAELKTHLPSHAQLARAPLFAVERVHHEQVDERAFFQRYMLGNKPVIVVGFDASWVGLRDWSTATLLRDMPHSEITFSDQVVFLKK